MAFTIDLENIVDQTVALGADQIISCEYRLTNEFTRIHSHTSFETMESEGSTLVLRLWNVNQLSHIVGSQLQKQMRFFEEGGEGAPYKFDAAVNRNGKITRHEGVFIQQVEWDDMEHGARGEEKADSATMLVTIRL